STPDLSRDRSVHRPHRANRTDRLRKVGVEHRYEPGHATFNKLLPHDVRAVQPALRARARRVLNLHAERGPELGLLCAHAGERPRVVLLRIWSDLHDRFRTLDGRGVLSRSGPAPGNRNEEDRREGREQVRRFTLEQWHEPTLYPEENP